MDSFRYETEEDQQTTSLELSSWLQPKQESNYKSAIRKLDKKLRQAVYYGCKNEFDHDLTVFDLKVSGSGLKRGKASYMSASITLYKNKEDSCVTDILENIGNVLSENPVFVFNSFKKGQKSNK